MVSHHFARIITLPLTLAMCTSSQHTISTDAFNQMLVINFAHADSAASAFHPNYFLQSSLGCKNSHVSSPVANNLIIFSSNVTVFCSTSVALSKEIIENGSLTFF